jgi:hypothetical protein
MGEAPLASVPFAFKAFRFVAIELAWRKVFRHFANPLIFEPLPKSHEKTCAMGACFRHNSP